LGVCCSISMLDCNFQSQPCSSIFGLGFQKCLIVMIFGFRFLQALKALNIETFNQHIE
jgi:hypothetical protein